MGHPCIQRDRVDHSNGACVALRRRVGYDCCALFIMYTRPYRQQQCGAGQELMQPCNWMTPAPGNAGQPQRKGLTWGMMPLLAGAMCACTHHFFYNDPKLDSLVALQVGHLLRMCAAANDPRVGDMRPAVEACVGDAGSQRATWCTCALLTGSCHMCRRHSSRCSVMPPAGRRPTEFMQHQRRIPLAPDDCAGC